MEGQHGYSTAPADARDDPAR